MFQPSSAFFRNMYVTRNNVTMGLMLLTSAKKNFSVLQTYVLHKLTQYKAQNCKINNTRNNHVSGIQQNL
jgi:hypothetical protein